MNMDLTSNIQRIIFKLLFAVSACSVLLWFSLFSYGLLYYLYIPAIAHVKPVHLFYDIKCTKGQHCQNPYANVSLTQNNDYELLTRGQAYAIELVLDMPESERNLQQGMFMIRLDMLSETGQVLQSSRRPAILRYRSALFKVIYTLFYMPALLLGSTEEKQTLHIPLFEQFVEYNPTYYIYIEIEAEVAEVYSSALKIHAQFTGLRYMMYYWPVLSLVIGVGSNFFFVTTVAVFIWIRHEMNGSETNGIQQIHASERESVEEIRRAMRQKKMETEKSSGGGFERTDPSTVPAEVLTLSPHRSESSSSYESQEPSSVAEKSSSSDIGIRQRLATTE